MGIFDAIKKNTTRYDLAMSWMVEDDFPLNISYFQTLRQYTGGYGGFYNKESRESHGDIIGIYNTGIAH